MASKALISTASALPTNRAILSGPSSVGFGPRSVSFLPKASEKPSSRPNSLVAKALQHRGSGVAHAPLIEVPSGGAVHTPLTMTEDEYEVKMRIDMPGMAAEDIDVKVEGDMLIIKDLGRQMFSHYDTELQLPPYCLKHDVKAIFKNGVLHISIPKTLYVLPKPATPIFKGQAGAPGGANKVHVPIQVHDNPNSPRPVLRGPWSHIEDNDQVMVSLDMPGLWPEDIEIDIVNDLLIIKGSEHNVDYLGRKILSYDVKFQLPINCVKERTNAVFKNGVVYITVPKTKPINFVQVRSA